MHSLEFLISAPNVPRLGDPRRAPDFAYSEWGLEKGKHRRASDALYTREWECGSKRQMQMVVDATESAGLGSYADMLRQDSAREVSIIVQQSGKRVRCVEVCAGVSTVDACRKLEKDNVDLEKLEVVAFEPSKDRLNSMTSQLTKMGLVEGKNFRAFNDIDINVLKYVEEGSVDIAVAVATLHHHAYLFKPVKELYKALADKGMLIISDWHNSAWTNPSHIYHALIRNYEWPTKEKDLYEFAKLYPNALQEPPQPLDPLEQEANRIILDVFWPQLGKLRAKLIESGEFRPEDDLLQIEGHRPVGMQTQTLVRAGFKMSSEAIYEIMEAAGIRTNPHRINAMLASSIAQKVYE